jgi:hypothetical protein
VRVPEPLTALLREACDPMLDAAISAWLKKQPSARPSSAAALAAMLERSALARASSPSDAEAWWQAHRPALEEHRASSVPEVGHERGLRSVVVGK